MVTAQTAFFTPDGDVYVPHPVARGPWGQTVSGTFVGGLLGYATEAAAGDPDFQPARFTVDLSRPVGLGVPVRVRTTVLRESRRLKLVDAVLTQDGAFAARATTLFLRRGEQPADEIFTSPVTMPEIPQIPDPIPEKLATVVWTYGREDHIPTPGVGLTAWEHSGPKHVWIHDFRPVVAGTELTPFVRAALAGDIVSSLAHFGPSGLQWINADYTLSLSRLPDGPLVGMAADTHFSHDGVATGSATVVDRLGPIGNGIASALANPGFAPPPRM
ncbi:acyl-CoA thioesterase domain-containing protein [Mycolicibacterium phlei]